MAGCLKIELQEKDKADIIQDNLKTANDKP